MKKHFKLKIIILSIACAGLLAFGICYLVIPEQTKDFLDKLILFLNQPLPIVGISILMLCYTAYKIFLLTSVGRKGIATIKEEYDETKTKVNVAYDFIKNKEQELVKKENDLIAYTSAINDKVDILTNDVMKVCETSPNAKIKAIGVEIKEKTNSIETELTEKLSTNEFKKAIEERVNIDELKDLISELKALKEELSYGEQREKNKDN